MEMEKLCKNSWMIRYDDDEMRGCMICYDDDVQKSVGVYFVGFFFMVYVRRIGFGDNWYCNFLRSLFGGFSEYCYMYFFL